MEICANTKVSDIGENGTAEQKAVAYYFDKDNNGIIDENEASLFTSSQVELSSTGLKITSEDGQTSVFENMAKAKSPEYYSQGSIPVAVIDIFWGSDECFGMAAHGNTTANIIKKENPDISVSRFDTAPVRAFNSTQRAICEFCEKHPKIGEFLGTNEYANAIMRIIYPNETQLKPYEIALDEVKAQMDNGKEFKAVNLSSGIDCSYEELNKICGKDLGCEITPDNIAQYKTQIREIFAKKVKSGEIDKVYDSRNQRNASAKQVLSIIEKIEALGVPTYISQAYKAVDAKGNKYAIQSIGLLSLAKNTRTVEGGTQYNGSIQSPNSSTNSFAIDEKTGERRIEDSLCFAVASFGRNSTSFAAPMRLAKDLKNQ